MTENSLFLIIGGLGLFFFGMRTMSMGLKKVAGERLKAILHHATKLPLIGVLVGAFVTCLIQSSSATTVMVVGFVNAGLLSLKQSISVVMGANIGTTFTAWLVSSMSVFKITSYALPCIGIGFAVMAISKIRKNQAIGEVLLGFGMLFLGLHFMKDACDPLRDSQIVRDIFVSFCRNPLLGIFVGGIFTVILQSSSATIAILQVLAFNGVIPFESTLPVILGDNIGTTITAQLAAIGTNINARRTAMSHTMFNVLGTMYMLVFVYLGWYAKAVDFLIPGEVTSRNIMLHIAVAHTLFNVVNTIIFLPLIGLLERISIWLVPKKKDTIDFETKYLEPHLLDTPTLALEQIHNEIAYMMKVAEKAVSHALTGLFEGSLKSIEKVSELEDFTDTLQSEITQYIVELSQRNLAKEESSQLPVLIHNVNDIERIGDHSQNLSELIKRKIEENLPFTDSAMAEIRNMVHEINCMLTEGKKALQQDDLESAEKMLEREGKVNLMRDTYKQNHIRRLHEGSCNMNAGFIFVELIDNLEKIGDRLTNVAQSVIGRMQWEVAHRKVLPQLPASSGS